MLHGEACRGQGTAQAACTADGSFHSCLPMPCCFRPPCRWWPIWLSDSVRSRVHVSHGTAEAACSLTQRAIALMHRRTAIADHLLLCGCHAWWQSHTPEAIAQHGTADVMHTTAASPACTCAEHCLAAAAHQLSLPGSHDLLRYCPAAAVNLICCVAAIACRGTRLRRLQTFLLCSHSMLRHCLAAAGTANQSLLHGCRATR